jgi:hypothetical protein
MTDPQYKPGDLVNGHVLAVQPDGSQAWLPIGADQHKRGDIANGHRLIQQPDGTLAWLPLGDEPKPKKKPGRGQWIAFGVSAALVLSLLILGIVSVATAGRSGSDPAPAVAGDTAWDKEQAGEEPAEEEPAVAKVEKKTVPNVIGMEASTAVAALRVAGFEVADAAEPTAIVTATNPSRGGIAEVGSPVTMVVEPPKPKLSLSQQNAVAEAQSYLDYSSFSRSGLIHQLEYEGYSTDDATFAVDFIGADWNAQAAREAKSYLDYSSFSRNGLYEQLIYEGYSDAEANAGLAAVGY